MHKDISNLSASSQVFTGPHRVRESEAWTESEWFREWLRLAREPHDFQTDEDSLLMAAAEEAERF